jgi:hypothetical protein
VDVYSPDGRLLWSGFIDARPWVTSWNEFVYSYGGDAVTGEEVVVRYRLVEPFD